jgi:hypothetical protein
VNGGWIAVDLDGTLATYRGWNGGRIGEPIPAMVERVRAALTAGWEVRIFTARVGAGAGHSAESGRSDDAAFAAEQRAAVEAWCEEHIGQRLVVTAIKDFRLVEIWDDRACGVEANTGRLLSPSRVVAS